MLVDAGANVALKNKAGLDPRAVAVSEERAAARRAAPPVEPAVPQFGVDPPSRPAGAGAGGPGGGQKKGIPIPAILAVVAVVAETVRYIGEQLDRAAPPPDDEPEHRVAAARAKAAEHEAHVAGGNDGDDDPVDADDDGRDDSAQPTTG